MSMNWIDGEKWDVRHSEFKIVLDGVEETHDMYIMVPRLRSKTLPQSTEIISAAGTIFETLTYQKLALQICEMGIK